MAKGFVWALVLCCLLTLLFGCKRTEYITVPQIRTEYVQHTDTLRLMSADSVWLHDSIFIDRWTSGDTVYVAKEVYKTGTRWRDRIIYKVRADTLLRSDTVTVVRPVEAQLSKAQRRYITLGKYAAGVIVAVIVAVACLAVRWLVRKRMQRN